MFAMSERNSISPKIKPEVSISGAMKVHSTVLFSAMVKVIISVLDTKSLKCNKVNISGFAEFWNILKDSSLPILPVFKSLNSFWLTESCTKNANYVVPSDSSAIQ